MLQMGNPLLSASPLPIINLQIEAVRCLIHKRLLEFQGRKEWHPGEVINKQQLTDRDVYDVFSQYTHQRSLFVAAAAGWE